MPRLGPSQEKITSKCHFAVALMATTGAIQAAHVKCAYNIPQKVLKQVINNTIAEEAWIFKDFFQTEWGLSILWSCILAMACFSVIPALLMAKSLANQIGRKSALNLSLLLAGVGVILQATAGFAHLFWTLAAGLALHAFSAGLTISVSALFISEIIPKQRQKHFYRNLDTLLVSGFLPLVLVCGLPQIFGTQERWYFLLLLPAVSVFIGLAGLAVLPESPKFLCLARSKNICELELSLKFYFGNSISSFFYVDHLLREELQENPPIRGFAAIRSAVQTHSFQLKYVYLTLVAGILKVIGFSAVISMLSTVILSEGMGLDEQVSALSTLVAFCFAFPALFFVLNAVEDYGKRFLYLFGSSVQLFSYFCLFILGLCATHCEHLSRELRYLSILFFLLCIISHKVGLSTLPDAIVINHLYYSSLAEPTKALGLVLGFLFDGLIVLVFWPLQKVIGPGYPWLLILCPLLGGFVYFVYQLPGNPNKQPSLPSLHELMTEYGKLHWPTRRMSNGFGSVPRSFDRIPIPSSNRRTQKTGMVKCLSKTQSSPNLGKLGCEKEESKTKISKKLIYIKKKMKNSLKKQPEKSVSFDEEEVQDRKHEKKMVYHRSLSSVSSIRLQPKHVDFECSEVYY